MDTVMQTVRALLDVMSADDLLEVDRLAMEEYTKRGRPLPIVEALPTETLKAMHRNVELELDRRGVVVNEVAKTATLKAETTMWARYVDSIDDSKGVPFVFRIEGDWIKDGDIIDEGRLLVVGGKYTGEEGPHGNYVLMRGVPGGGVAAVAFRDKSFRVHEAEVLASNAKLGSLETRIRDALEGKT